MIEEPNKAIFSWIREGLPTGSEVLKAFLFVSFPIHLWAIYFWFSTADRFSSRLAWELLGITSYILVAALFETIILTFVLLILGLLLPRSWSRETRQTGLLGLFLVATFWAWLQQVLAGLSARNYKKFTEFFAPINQPSMWPLLIFLLILVVSVALPVWAAGRPGWQRVLIGLAERVSLLSWLYLALDVAGLVVVIIRNL